MKLELAFSMDNDAFVNAPEAESARILRDIAEKIEGGYTSGPIFDHNGSCVGTWDIDTD